MVLASQNHLKSESFKIGTEVYYLISECFWDSDCDYICQEKSILISGHHLANTPS